MQAQPSILNAKLKCSIIKDLFSQIVKNKKQSTKFYLNISDMGIRMVFLQNAKEVEVFVCLSKPMFQTYTFNQQQPVVRLYDIRDFQLISIIFENQSAILEINIKDTQFIVSQDNEFTGRTSYRINACHIYQDIPEQVYNTAANQSQNHTKIELTRMKGFFSVIHSLSLQKIQNFELRFKKSESDIQLVPLPEMVTDAPVANSEQSYTLKVLYGETQLLDHLRFNVRKFKVCLGMFDKGNKIMFTFYPNCAKIELVDKQMKNVQIILSCLS